jgi:hypothetical protein
MAKALSLDLRERVVAAGIVIYGRPPDCKWFLMLNGGLGLQSSIRPLDAAYCLPRALMESVDRRPVTLSSFSLGQSLGFGRSRSPCFAITSSSPSQLEFVLSSVKRLPMVPSGTPHPD